MGSGPLLISGVVTLLLGGAVFVFALRRPDFAVNPSVQGIASAESLLSLVVLVVVTALLKFLRLWIVGAGLIILGMTMITAGLK